jgi:NDP-sugar pyrophosphorylase family protein
MTDSLAGTRAGTNSASLVAVVLAAGEGRRLRPLTLRRPKPLCPVGNVALVDHALARARLATPAVAVNVHHGREQLESHLEPASDVHVSIEAVRALGTAGGVGHLRSWIDGRDALIVNADTWCEADLAQLRDGWDRSRPRVVVAGDAVFGPRVRVVASFLPWATVRDLSADPAELYETTWRPAAVDDRLEVVGYAGACFDCGTPAAYLAANLEVARRAGGAVIGPTSRVDGEVDAVVAGEGCSIRGKARSSVLWDHATVREGESLDRAIRVSATMTVLVR